jgi:hypothetical protein
MSEYQQYEFMTIDRPLIRMTVLFWVYHGMSPHFRVILTITSMSIPHIWAVFSLTLKIFPTFLRFTDRRTVTCDWFLFSFDKN